MSDCSAPCDVTVSFSHSQDMLLNLLLIVSAYAKSLTVDQAAALLQFGFCSTLPSTSSPNCSWVQEANCTSKNVTGVCYGVCCDATLGVIRFLFDMTTRVPTNFTSLPCQLGLFTDLSYCEFSNQGLTGGIPSELGELSELKDL